MRHEKKYILKNVLTADSIDSRGSFGFDTEDNKVLCQDCLSPLFYVAKSWGVVEEDCGMNIAGYHRGSKYLALREIGLCLYCSECGAYNEDYNTWIYPDNKIVYGWADEGLDYAERGEIELAMDLYNKTGKVEQPYISAEINVLKGKLKEYEEKNTPEKEIQHLNKRIKEIEEEVKEKNGRKQKKK